MDDEQPDFLTLEEIRQRLETYSRKPHDLEHAKDCGLFAFSVPARYGGLPFRDWLMTGFYDGREWFSVYGRVRSLSERVARCTIYHHGVCKTVIQLGTAIQRSIFLPSLASGKLIGAGASSPQLDLKIERTENGYVVSGGLHTSDMINGASTLVRVAQHRDDPVFVIPIMHLLSRRDIRNGKNTFKLDRLFIPDDFYFAPSSATRDASEWQIVRWGNEQP